MQNMQKVNVCACVCVCVCARVYNYIIGLIYLSIFVLYFLPLTIYCGRCLYVLVSLPIIFTLSQFYTCSFVSYLQKWPECWRLSQNHTLLPQQARVDIQLIGRLVPSQYGERKLQSEQQAVCPTIPS